MGRPHTAPRATVIDGNRRKRSFALTETTFRFFASIAIALAVQNNGEDDEAVLKQLGVVVDDRDDACLRLKVYFLVGNKRRSVLHASQSPKYSLFDARLERVSWHVATSSVLRRTAAMRRFYIRKRKEFNRYAIILPFQIFNTYYKVAKPDDFLTHYAGYGTGRGVAKNKDKYDKLTRMIMKKFSGDREIEPSSVTCIHDIAGLVSASCEVYDGVTRYQDVSWFGKLRLRAFPSKIERMVV